MTFISSNGFNESDKYLPYEAFGELKQSYSTVGKKKLSVPRKSK